MNETEKEQKGVGKIPYIGCVFALTPESLKKILQYEVVACYLLFF